MAQKQHGDVSLIQIQLVTFYICPMEFHKIKTASSNMAVTWKKSHPFVFRKIGMINSWLFCDF